MASKQDKAVTMMRDKFAALTMGQADSSAFHALPAEIESAFPKMPRYERTYLHGYFAALLHGLYKDSIVHGGFYKGQFYSTVSGRLDYYGAAGIEARTWTFAAERKGFYWTDARGKCNGSRPFFTGND